MGKKTLVSGIQPSGKLHIGNYFGALEQFVKLQDEYNPFIFIVDYHALTTLHDADALRENVYNLTLDYLAVGLDPAKVALYKQSAIPEVTELTWVFNTLITVPYLQRAHAFKDKTSKGIDPSVGLFDYPVLMAADILLPGGEVVPVGEDQRQHIEIAREIGRKFNATFGEFFKEPEEMILENVAVVPGTDGQKMSKSYGNTIGLFASEEETKEAVMSIVTDSKGVDEPKDPSTDTVFALHRLVTPEEKLAEISEGYEKGGLGYGEAKKMLVESTNDYFREMRERRNELEKDKDYVFGVLEEGGKKAREIVEPRMAEIRKLVGLN